MKLFKVKEKLEKKQIKKRGIKIILILKEMI